MSADTELTREELRRTARHLNLPGFGIEQQRQFTRAIDRRPASIRDRSHSDRS